MADPVLNPFQDKRLHDAIKTASAIAATPNQAMPSLLARVKADRKFGEKLYKDLTEDQVRALVETGVFDIEGNAIVAAKLTSNEILQAQAFSVEQNAREEHAKSENELSAGGFHRGASIVGGPLPRLARKGTPPSASMVNSARAPIPSNPRFLVNTRNFVRTAEDMMSGGDVAAIAAYRDAISSATAALQAYLGASASAGSGQVVPSHVVHLDEGNASELMHSGQENLSRLAKGPQQGRQLRFPDPVAFGTEYGFAQDANPISQANELGVIVLEAENLKAYGQFNDTHHVTARFRRNADGSIVVSDRPPSAILDSSEFFLTIPIVIVRGGPKTKDADIYDASGSSGRGALDESRRAGLRDTILHETWHALLSRLSPHWKDAGDARKDSIKRHKLALLELEKAAPDLYGRIVEMLAGDLVGYPAAAVNEEIAVRITSKISTLIMSDPAELEVVIQEVMANTPAQAPAANWLFTAIQSATDHILAVVESVIGPEWTKNAVARTQEFLGAAGAMRAASAIDPKSPISMHLASLSLSPDDARAHGMRLAMMAAELRTQLAALGMSKPISSADVNLGDAAVSSKRGKMTPEGTLKEVIALIRAANRQFRPMAIAAHQLSAGIAPSTSPSTTPRAPRKSVSSARPQLEVGNVLAQRDTTEDRVTVQQEPREIKSKSIAGRTLELIGLSIAKAYVVAKSAVEIARNDDKSIVGRKPSLENYFKANIDRFAAVEDKYKTLVVNASAIEADPSYQSLTAQGRDILAAAIATAEGITGDDLQDALSFSRSFEPDQEELITDLISKTKATGATKSTLEFLVRLAAADKFGEQIENNARRKAGDPGWAIPELKQILVEDGELSFVTGTLSWNLTGTKPIPKGTVGEDRKALQRVNDDVAKKNKQTAVKNIVGRVRDLEARAKAGDENATRIMRENRWYNEIFDRLVVAFGSHQTMFTELLAALSPQTPADTNYRYAVDAMQNFTRGTYDALLRRYVDWVADPARLARIAELDEDIAARDAVLRDLRKKTGRKYPGAKDRERVRLTRERAVYSVYTGPTPFRDIVVTQGLAFPSDPYENKRGEIITPKPKIFETIDHLANAYGPAKADFDGGGRGYKKARREWIATVKRNHPHAFDKRGRLVEGAVLTVSRKFGINSRAALNVMAGLWAQNVSSPKVHTFFSNLAGLGTNATIDLWAARAIRSSLGLPRIPAFAETAVKGTVKAGNIDVISGEYAFGQEIMTEAANQLGMAPMNLQALLWFAEKDLWDENGWTSAAGAGGSFERAFDRDPLTLIEAEVDASEIEPDSEVLSELLKSLQNDNAVIAIRYDRNQRSLQGRRLGLSMTVRYRQFDTNDFAAKIAAALRSSGSTPRVTVTQTLPYGAQKTPNSRPAFTVLFPRPKTDASARGLISQIETANPGWHIEPMPDPRVDKNGVELTNPIVGMRIHYAGEIDPAMRANASSATDETTASQDTIVKLRTDALLDYLSEMRKMKLINDSARAMAVESITFGLEGVPNDQRRMAAFSDFRTGQPQGARSIQGLASEAVGIVSGDGDAEHLGYEPADGYAEGTDSIAERVVPEEIARQQRQAVNNTYQDDGLTPEEEADIASGNNVRLSIAPIPPAEGAIPIPADTDIPLPPGMETPEPDGGAVAAMKRFFGVSSDVPVISNRKPNDLGMFRRWMLPLISSAWGSGNRRVRFVAETLVSTDLERMRVTQGQIRQGQDLYSKLPSEYRKDKGRKFYLLMDRFYDPEKPNGDRQWVDGEGKRIPDDVIDVLREFKRIDEEQRLGIINAKRETASEIARYMNVSRLIKVAAENGSNWRAERIQYGPRRRDSQLFIVDDDTGMMLTPDEAREAIVKIMIPDDWGRQFAHVFHAFFGSYEGFWFSKSAYRKAKADGKSDSEALLAARRSIAMDGGTAAENTEAAMARRLLAFRRNPPPGVNKDDIGRIEIKVQSHVPPDVVRVSGRQYDALRRHIKEAANVSGDVVSEMLRGRVGRSEGKQRFYAPLLERTGKEGFDMDFLRSWEAQTSGFYKWLYFNRLRKDVTETIEDLKRDGFVGWAGHFQDTLEYTTTFRQSQFEQGLDGLIASVPGIRTLVGPMPTRRWLQMVRTVNVMRQLWTVRQQVVNSMQPFQTIFPIIGGRKFLEYVKRYNTREGKEILSRYGYLRPNGEWYEGREFRLTSGTGWLTRAYEPIKKIMEKSPIAGSESRNQNFTFVAFYLYAKEELRMADNEAARHALLRVAQTQFAFTKANNPVIFRGPTRSTLLQYKRFLLSSVGLAWDNIIMARHPVTGERLPARTRGMMFARWMTTFLAMGGLKGLPVWLLYEWLAAAMSDDEGTAGYDVHQKLREQFGENWANVVVMGLPAAAGIDISGSIVLFPKPYGRTTYEQIGSFIAGPTLSAFGDAYRSLQNKDAIYQSGFRELGLAAYSSSPAAQQVGTAIDLIAGESDTYDVQGRLKFRKTVAEQVRGVMGFRTIRESIESLEYNKIIAMRDALDGMKDEIATLAASGMIVEMQQKIRNWNSLFPDMPMPYSLNALMKDPSIGRRIKRKLDDRTMDTRQRRMSALNDDLAERLVRKNAFQEPDEQ